LEWMTSPSKVTSKDDLLPAFRDTATLPPNLSVIACPRPRALGRYPQTVQYSIVTMPTPSWGNRGVSLPVIPKPCLSILVGGSWANACGPIQGLMSDSRR
jgi:hypothetical protein